MAKTFENFLPHVLPSFTYLSAISILTFQAVSQEGHFRNLTLSTDVTKGSKRQDFFSKSIANRQAETYASADRSRVLEIADYAFRADKSAPWLIWKTLPSSTSAGTDLTPVDSASVNLPLFSPK
jgi:hypothetical protein